MCAIVTVLKDYFQQCAIAVSTEDVAPATPFLAKGNADQPVLSFEDRRRVNAVLLTAGTYSAAGDTAYRMDLPVKSGIGEGIAGCLPCVGAACPWSPRSTDTATPRRHHGARETFETRRLVALLTCSRRARIRRDPTVSPGQ